MNLFSRSSYLGALAVALLLIAPLLRSITAQTNSSSQCAVCHNGTNPHTIFIPCDKVNQYLANHPGDYAGQCTGVTKEKPPKGSPTPKPTKPPKTLN